MVHSVIFYTVAAICTSLLLDGSLKVNGLEKPFDNLEAEAKEHLKDVEEFIDNMRRFGRDIIEIKDDLVMEVVRESVDSVNAKLDKTRNGGKDVSQCRQVAASKTAKSIIVTNKDISPCADSIQNKLSDVITSTSAVKEPIQKVIEEIKIAAEKCSAKTLTPEESNSCSEKNVASFKTTIDDMKAKAEDIMYSRYASILEIFGPTVECFQASAANLKTALKAVEIDIDSCVAAAQKN